jgi:hypothetical protein
MVTVSRIYSSGASMGAMPWLPAMSSLAKGEKLRRRTGSLFPDLTGPIGRAVRRPRLKAGPSNLLARFRP